MVSLSTFFRRSLLDIDGALLQHLAGDHLNTTHAQGRTLDEHLRGTQRILAAWGQSTVLQRAGLCHSLYSTDGFEHCSIPLSDRSRVQKAIGKEAEELVFLFCAIERSLLFRNILRASSLESSVTISIEAREGFEVLGQAVSGTQARDLLLLHLANSAEQAGSRNGRLTPWLEQFQKLVQLLEDKAPKAVPPVLKELRVIGRYGERQALTSYLRAIRANGNSDTAISLMEEVARLLPLTADPHVWLSWFWSQKNERSKRRYHARLAREKLLTFGAAWDKRLSFDGWLALARSGEKTKTPDNAFDSLRQLIKAEETLESTDTPAMATGSNLNSGAGQSRFESYLLDVAAAKNRKVSGFYPGLRETAFWPPEQFQLAATLQSEFIPIQEEIAALDPSQFHDEAERIRRTGKWQVLMLLEAGRWHEENLTQLPLLSRILRASQEIRLAGGLAYLSRLSPGTVVSPHTGPTNMRLRMHFAIKVPDGDCAMRVAGIEQRWIEGESTVFNDFWEHEVWNRTDSERLVLLVDIWHPDITLQERKMLEAIHWMAEQHGHGLLEYWKKNEVMRQESGIAAAIGTAEVDNLAF